MRAILLALAILTLAVGGAIAGGNLSQQDRDVAHKTATELATCAGFYEAISRAARSADPTMSKHYHEVANGAWIAAAMAASSIIEPKHARQYADSIRDVQETFWTLHIRDMPKVDAEFSKRGSICEDLNPIQVYLVEEARKQAYGFKPKPK